MDKFKSKKGICIIIIVFTVLIVLAWGIFVWNNTHLSNININNYQLYLNYTEGYIMFLDSVNSKKDEISITKDYITVDGWIINQNKSFDRVNIDLVFKNLSTGEAIILPTTMMNRTDVTEAFGEDERTYDWSGFRTKIPYSSKVDTEKYDYEILARIKINDENAVIVDSGKNTGDYK